MALPRPWQPCPDRTAKEAGQAHVHPVRHPQLEGVYALKVLKNAARRARFTRELQTMRDLANAGAPVPTVLDEGEDSKGRPYYVMPWYDLGPFRMSWTTKRR